MPGNIGLWMVRGLTLVGGCMLFGGILILSSIGGPTSILSGCSESSRACGYFVVVAMALPVLGGVTTAIGIALQRRIHDEWGFTGILHEYPKGTRKWAKCGQCGGLMKADTKVCPFCGERKLLEPLAEREPLEETGIRATVSTRSQRPGGRGWEHGLRGRCFVEFERGYLFLEGPRKAPVPIWPKKVLRTSNVSLLLETSTWDYGKVTLTFDSASDADTVERAAQKLVGQRPEQSSELESRPPQ